MSLWRRDDLEDALTRWREAGLLSQQTVAELEAFERARRAAGPPSGASARMADAAACVGLALVAAAAIVLAFAQFGDDFGPQIAVLSVAGALALAASLAARRLRLPVASDLLGGAAVVLWTVAVAAALDELGVAGGANIGWALICAVAAVAGAAVWRAADSIAAGVLAVVAWVLAPMALSAGDELDELFVNETSTARAAAAMLLMTLAAVLAAVGAHYALRRGWLDSIGVWCIAFVATTAIGVAIGILAVSRPEPGLDFALLIGAVAATAVAVRRREWVWLPSAACLSYSASVSSLTDIEDLPRNALALIVLVLSFFPFAPLARRLPQHWVVRVWELVVWATGLTTAIGFAAASGGWPAAGGVWAAAMILSAARLRRPLALAAGVLGLYAAFVTIVIETFDASVGAGFGTLAFGLIVLGAVLEWRRRRVDTDQPRS